MTAAKTQKRFLDTSVLRPMLHGSAAYKRHLEEQMGSDPCYISQYVMMEFRRSFIMSLVAFYFYLELPTIKTVGDALQLWSHKFKAGELKAVMQLIAQLLDAGRIGTENPRDLEKAQLAIGRYIKRVDAKARRKFKDSSKDTTGCGRAAVPLKIDLHRLREDLQIFNDAFANTKACRSQCRIEDLPFTKYRQEVDDYIKLAGSLPSRKETQGFVRIADKLADVLAKGDQSCSCTVCGAIGDAVIALDAPREMCLEHVDQSFDHLCPPINQTHRKHSSEVRVLKGT